MSRKCYDAKRKGKDRLALVPTRKTFRDLWKDEAKTALFAVENHDRDPETRYEMYAVAGCECPSHAEVEKLVILCPECGEPMKRVSVPSMSNSIIRDFGEYRCPKCFQKAWDTEREGRATLLALRELEGRI